MDGALRRPGRRRSGFDREVLPHAGRPLAGGHQTTGISRATNRQPETIKTDVSRQGPWARIWSSSASISMRSRKMQKPSTVLSEGQAHILEQFKQFDSRCFAAAESAGLRSAARAVCSQTAAALLPQPCITRRSQISGHIIT
jgi:hypothetical protein